MKKTTAILATSILIVVIILSTFAVYKLYVAPEGGSSQGGPITVVDWQGVNVTLQAPAKTVISLSSGMTELIYALDCGDKMVGRDSYSDFPPTVLDKPVVAPHDYNPPLEQILELKPDLLVASTNLVYGSNETRRTLEEAGIAVYVDETSTPDRVKTCITNLGILLGAKDRAKEIVSFIENYENLVQNRVKDLKESEKPRVYLELWSEWNTVAEGSVGHKLLVYVGGSNIAAGQPIPYPIVSPEFVAEKNPEIIIRMKMAGDPDYPILRQQIMNRSALREVDAVKNGKVYIYDPIIMQGVRYPAGLLYWAKWINPELFEDVDPEAVHKELSLKFFGLELEGVYTYP
ncbi:MAG: ABC transporter substrate-binding protein [Candidatus Bathyarchaeales archaeon]